MVRKDTNKQYSLRKLKTGTASVAVAVAVLGAGFANQTEVKAKEHESVTRAREAAIRQMMQQGGRDFAPLLAETMRDNNNLRETLDETKKEIDDLKSENEGLGTTLQKKEQELKGLKDDAELQRLKNERHEEAELERLKSERHEHDKKEAERKALEDKLADKQEHLDGALRYINEKEAERKEKEAEQKKLKEEKQISDASRQGLRRD
ncbi:TPA: YSIRK-type signal peptide-containing protein, partial [Streptococcus pyogenes]